MENCGNKDFTDINKRDIMNYQDWLYNDLGLSPNRVRHLKSAISSMSNYIETILDREFPQFRNVINKIKPPVKRDVREKTVLTEEQVETLLETLLAKKKYQQACFVACLAASGLRKAEIIQLKTNYFTTENLKYGMYRTPEKLRCKGSGREGKKLHKYLAQGIMQKYFDLWMMQRKELGIENEYLFVVKRHEQWQQAKISTVDSWMDAFTKILSVDVYCHAFRHYTATWLKRNNVDISKIRDLLGHESSSTSELYVDIDESENMQGMFDFIDNEGNLKQNSEE
jgi:integrase